MSEHHPKPTAEAAQALAEATAAAMWSRDRAATALGMAIQSVKPGYARLSMPVRGAVSYTHLDVYKRQAPRPMAKPQRPMARARLMHTWATSLN